jgi:streptomycin 6-kinase
VDGVPAVLRNKARLAGAGSWVDDLPAIVAGLERDWSIVVGAPYTNATEAFVARASLQDGTPAVLKLMVPRDGHVTHNEITALRLADGDGCVGLLRADEVRHALLLERLGRSLHDFGLPLAERHEILCATVERMWRPAAGSGLPTGAAKGRWLCDFITTMWTDLDYPCSERVVDHALACAQRRIAAHDDERAVLVHGDVHEWNTLQADAGFKLVDPDGLLAEAEYDLGVILREDPADFDAGDPHARARWLAQRCDLDATAIWEWSVVERVSSALLLTKVDQQPSGRRMLAAAERAAAARDR